MSADSIEQPYSRYVPAFDDLPAALADFPIWCVWKLIPKDGKKPDKVPVSANPATLDSHKWSAGDFCTTAAQAISYAKAKPHLHGIGIILRKGCGIAGGDIDGCTDLETGEISPVTQRIIAEANTYTEVSPGLSGFLFLVLGTFGGFTGNNAAKGVEFYEEGRFLTITGRHYPGPPPRRSKARPARTWAQVLWQAGTAAK